MVHSGVKDFGLESQKDNDLTKRATAVLCIRVLNFSFVYTKIIRHKNDL